MRTFFDWMKRAQKPQKTDAEARRPLPVVIDNATGAVIRADLPRFARRHDDTAAFK